MYSNPACKLSAGYSNNVSYRVVSRRNVSEHVGTRRNVLTLRVRSKLANFLTKPRQGDNRASFSALTTPYGIGYGRPCSGGSLIYLVFLYIYKNIYKYMNTNDTNRGTAGLTYGGKYGIIAFGGKMLVLNGLQAVARYDTFRHNPTRADTSRHVPTRLSALGDTFN